MGGAAHGFNNLTQTDIKALAFITLARLSKDFFKEAGWVIRRVIRWGWPRRWGPRKIEFGIF
jgi:hypothetical protein